MNSQLLIQNIVRFVLLFLLQVLVFNNVYLGGYINPFLFVLFIAMLPTGMSAITMMLISFASGLAIDLTTNMIGFHAFTCTAVAFLRGVWFDRIIMHDSNEEVNTPSLYSVPYQQFGVYMLLMLLVYNAIYYTLLVFDLHDIGHILLSTVLSTIVTWLLAILYQTLLVKRTEKQK